MTTSLTTRSSRIISMVRAPTIAALVIPYICFKSVLTSGFIQAGEFSVDLYTLPDTLGKMIWDYLVITCTAIATRTNCADTCMQVKQSLVEA